MNVLPIPALDGGHVMFLLYEMISGRKPNDKVMEYAQMFGFFLLLALVLFANGNDLYRWLCDRNDRNDKENGKSYMRRIARGLQISCHSCHLCHIQSK